MIIFLVFGCNVAFTSNVKETQTAGTPLPPSRVNGELTRPGSPLWRISLWEALPPKWLQGSRSNELLEAYQLNDWKPFFLNARFELTESARLLLKRLEEVEREAIDPKLFHLSFYKQALASLEKQRLALLSIHPDFDDSHAEFLSPRRDSDSADAPPARGTQVRYAMNAPTLPPSTPLKNDVSEEQWREIFKTSSELDTRLTRDLITLSRELSPYNQKERFSALTGAVSMAQYLESLEPNSVHYRPLVKAYEGYRALAAEKASAPISGDMPLRPGDKGDQVRNLQKRLLAEGFYKGKVSGVFDAGTLEAVKAYQSAHKLAADGVVGNQTRMLLNSGLEDKVQLIAESIKSIRRSETRRFPERHIRVNIPEFQLEYHKNGKIEAVHKVIVGKAGGKKIKVQGRMISENNTPPLASAIERIVINPRWYVSDRIRLELNDNLAADPAYFAKHGYVAMNSSSYPWGEPRLFQKPGPTNPLGQVKFEFPNAYAVFLHDTPKRQLFSKNRRDLSHGCIRVDKARELAARILEDEGNAAVEKLDAYYAVLRPTHINLSQPLPIVLEYVPVTTDGRGHLVFAGDIYGWYKKDPPAAR